MNDYIVQEEEDFQQNLRLLANASAKEQVVNILKKELGL